MLEIEHLTKTFAGRDGTVQALKDVSLTIEDDEIFGIIGLSGAGKSTLVRCLNGLEKPTGGRVLFNGQDISRMDEAALRKTRRKMGMIFQNFNLMEQRTALENVCFPLEIAGMKKKDAVPRAAGLLARVGLSDKEQSYPSQLSGGQKQRVAIARAMAMDPEVLLCDEATSALDPATTVQILELLRSIHEQSGVTIVLITHAMRVVTQICDRVAVMSEGKIVEVGKTRDVFISPRSKTARDLILPHAETVEHMEGGRFLRLVFNGQDAYEPIISNLSVSCRTSVSILAANTRVVGDRTYGQMILQLPKDEIAVERIKDFLRGCEVSFEEVEQYVD